MDLKSWLFIIVKFPQIQYDVYYGINDFIYKFTISECFYPYTWTACILLLESTDEWLPAACSQRVGPVRRCP